MKYLVRIKRKGMEQVYFRVLLRPRSGAPRLSVSRYLGTIPPNDLKPALSSFFGAAASKAAERTDPAGVTPFRPDSIRTIEKARFGLIRLHHEYFIRELHDFRTAFAVLFTLNSNRAEGSKVTRPDIENIMRARARPRSALDVEIASSIEAMNIAFSKTMKWSTKGVRGLHAILLRDLQPTIVGRFRKVAVIVGAGLDPVTSSTVPWNDVPDAMRSLMKWLDAARRKKTYPPWIAAEFHWRFEKIHPFEDGNGRIGRILMNAILLQDGYMPVFFDARNTSSYSNALGKAMKGHPQTFASFFADQTARTQKAVEEYSAAIRSVKWARRPGPWKEPRGKLLVYDDPGSL